LGEGEARATSISFVVLQGASNETFGQKIHRPKGFRFEASSASWLLSNSPPWGCSFVAQLYQAAEKQSRMLSGLRKSLEAA
jgi:hypothetical protein